MTALAEAATRWVHNLDPYIIRFSDSFGLRWYGLSYVVGILAAVWILSRWVRARRLPLRAGETADLALYAGLGMVLGGRVYYCLFYAGDIFLRDPLYLVRIWEGGMASHGGILGMAAGTALFAWRRGCNLAVLADAIAAVAPLGVVFGRLANFINGELWGRPSEASWAVIFPEAPKVAGKMVARHPSQLYAAGLEGLIPFVLLLLIHARHRRPGLTVGACFLLYGAGRFVDEFWREPDAGYALFFGWMSKGQLFTIPLFAIGALLVALTLWRKPRPEAYRAPAPADRPGPERARR
ncbi:MAG: prolipoprotein diacylglyceryl transferase [Planctomycetes bacterium]|nr:prolipoprotein diacylglyceryl transferase [Planctomycetota bacterium]